MRVVTMLLALAIFGFSAAVQGQTVKIASTVPTYR